MLKKVSIVLLSLVLLVVLGVSFLFGYNSNKERLASNLTIKKGQNILQTAFLLEEHGLIKNRFRFALKAILSQEYKEIKAGTYQFTDENEKEIIDKIKGGKETLLEITIIPGQTTKDVAFLLQAQGLGNSQDILEFLLSTSSEGFLFPDTYQIASQEALENVVLRMRSNFKLKTKGLSFEERSLLDTVKMASLLEKEAQTEEDKRIIAGILWKRLDNGILLEVDSALNYFIASGGQTINSNPLLKELDSSYNTYKREGLPETPICNPSLASIEAALLPQETSYWFYLSSNEGEIFYAKTFDEHLINKAKYIY